MPLSWGIFILLLFIADVQKLSQGVRTLVEGQGYHLQCPEIQKLMFAHFMHTLLSVTEGDFKLNVQD